MASQRGSSSYRDSEGRVPPRYMTFEIASRLLERGDVSGAVFTPAPITRED